MANYLWEDNEWNFKKLQEIDAGIEKIACGHFGLDVYPNQIDIISSDQMLNAYSSHGMPIFYEHWSFGKHLTQQKEMYRRGYMGLAYEIVINSNPCIAYLMEENTTTMQALVIAHASYGHNSFFKNNYMFKQWTDAEGIIDYLIFARKYIRECEEKYGSKAVEEVLDSCHALMDHGVDRYKKPRKLNVQQEQERLRYREKVRQEQVNELWSTLPKNDELEVKLETHWPKEPVENLLYFFEKNAPLLENWQREIIRIVRKVSQYFYPQKQTKVMNEGWASFWHYTLFQEMFERDMITEASMIEFLTSHTGVVMQPDWNDKRFSGINVYALGFSVFRDLRRMCENPTDEDKFWFPDVAGTDWQETLTYAMENFRDESFISQFLSPKVIRDMKLFQVSDFEEDNKNYHVTGIHNEDGYRQIRKSLSNQYNLSMREPHIVVWNVNRDSDRTLFLRHFQRNNVPLDEKSLHQVLMHVRRLWGFTVVLESVDSDGDVVEEYLEE